MIDTSSFVNLITLEVFNKLGLDKSNLAKVSYILVGLRDKTVAVIDTIDLSLILGDEKHIIHGGRHSTRLQCHTRSPGLKLLRDSYYMSALCLKLLLQKDWLLFKAVKSQHKNATGILGKASGRQ